MAKDIFKGLGIASAVLGILALLFEGYLWQRQTKELTRLAERYEGRNLCMRVAEDVRLVYELTPGRCGTNRWGFLDEERFIERKDPELYRIVLIGDSVAAGQGVKRVERFGERLAIYLEEMSERKVEVVNLALTGYSTEQELIILERWGLRFQPDLVLWSYVLNDPAHPIFHDANGEAGRFFNRPGWRGYQYFERKLFEASEQWRGRNCPQEFHALLHCVYGQEIESNLNKLAKYAKHSDVLFAITPVLIDADSFSQYPYRWIHDDLHAKASELGLRSVDLLNAFASHDPRSLAQHQMPRFDPWHPNAKGHDLIALLLAEHILPRLNR